MPGETREAHARDQLGHSLISMTHDVYLGRRASNQGNLEALEAYNPDLLAAGDGAQERD